MDGSVLDLSLPLKHQLDDGSTIIIENKEKETTTTSSAPVDSVLNESTSGRDRPSSPQRDKGENVGGKSDSTNNGRKNEGGFILGKKLWKKMVGKRVEIKWCEIKW